jgi:hypothetical protein
MNKAAEKNWSVLHNGCAGVLAAETIFVNGEISVAT